MTCLETDSVNYTLSSPLGAVDIYVPTSDEFAARASTGIVIFIEHESH